MRTRNKANAVGLILNWAARNVVISAQNAGILVLNGIKHVGNEAKQLKLGLAGVDTTRNYRRR